MTDPGGHWPPRFSPSSAPGWARRSTGPSNGAWTPLAADAVDEALTDDVLADLAAAARAGATEVVSPDRAPQLSYASLPEFVEGFLAGVYARNFDTKGRTWWNHTEAVVRLDALWRA